MMSQTVPAFKIAMLPKYCRDGSSSRLRLYQYAESTPFSHFSIDIYPLYEESYIKELYEHGQRNKVGIFSAYLKRFFVLFKLFRYDVLWVEKEFFPRLPAVVERLFSLMGIHYVVDYDDATFHDYDLSKNLVLRHLMREKIDRVMQYASCVVCGNQYIQKRAQKAGAKVTYIVPTVVDANKYTGNPSEETQITIGWIGSPPTEKYLFLVKNALNKLLSQLEGRLMLIGTTDKVRIHFPDISLSLLPWSEDREAEYLAQIDIGIMPLKDAPWERGKCGFKLLQYMASGKPVVASPVGVNVDIVQASECGFLAKTEDDWFTQLLELSINPSLRKELGANGRRSVIEQYSLETQSPRLARMLVDHARKSEKRNGRDIKSV